MTSSVKINIMLVAIIDISIYVIAFFLSFYLRYGWDLPEYNLNNFYYMLPWFVIVFVILLIVYNLYSIYIKFDEILASLVCIVFLTGIINISLSFLFRQFAVPRSIFIISGVMQLLFLALWRYIVWRKGLLIKYPKKALIIGYPGETKKLLGSINISLKHSLAIAKEIRLNNKDNFENTWNTYINSLIANEIEVILICASVGQKERNIIFDYAINESKTTMLVPVVYDILLQQAKLVSAGDVPIIQLQGILSESNTGIVKRLIDITFSLVALTILMPIALIIAVLIKIDSTGPVFYSQTRTGLKGKVFKVYKFRTMIQDAEKLSGPVLAGKQDSRITRAGNFLRKTRLDEIPQFVNVLKGDMSLVGPRPERPFFIEEFSEKLPEFDYRHQIVCGLTGLAQVEGRYSTEPANKLIYDLFYAQKKSLLLDIAILLRTASVLLQRRKAA
jgi:exopolysaccharide biosynthesis polyprenyl glycosylphosphotransferase